MATLFTKIFRREIPAKFVYEDDLCGAIEDIAPQAPHHFLVIPKKEITSVASADAEDQKILGHLLIVAARVAREAGFADGGYRLVINHGENGGQTVSHLHIHVLGGRRMSWPPG